MSKANKYFEIYESKSFADLREHFKKSDANLDMDLSWPTGDFWVLVEELEGISINFVHSVLILALQAVRLYSASRLIAMASILPRSFDEINLTEDQVEFLIELFKD